LEVRIACATDSAHRSKGECISADDEKMEMQRLGEHHDRDDRAKLGEQAGSAWCWLRIDAGLGIWVVSAVGRYYI
jgi:hypothetical protein